MSDTLKDQLMKLGFRPPEPAPARAAKPEGKPQSNASQRAAQARRSDQPRPPRPGQAPRPGPPSRPGKGPQHGRPARERSREEIDLARAYALRAQTERAERERSEREAQERAREKKERRARIAALLEGKALNDASAEVARHFEHGSKIRRVYVTPAQLVALNRGELGIVQLQGRYVLVAREVALAAGAISDEALVLLPDPDAPVEDDIPPDLVW